MRSQEFRTHIVIFIPTLVCVVDAAQARGLPHFLTGLFDRGQRRSI
jgi:hypothetical protein